MTWMGGGHVQGCHFEKARRLLSLVSLESSLINMEGRRGEVSETSGSTDTTALDCFFVVDWPGSLPCQRSGVAKRN